MEMLLQPDLNTVLYALAVIVPLEYTFVALSSLVAKVVVANFVRDLGEISRSRETKRECDSVEHKIKARYKQSLLWPLEIAREIKQFFMSKKKD
jgi:hypothetical protein